MQSTPSTPASGGCCSVASFPVRSPKCDASTRQIVEAISFVSGDSPDTITVTVQPRLPDELGALISMAQAQRQRARELEASAARDLTRGARELVAHGLSQRDAAVILGVSHQRVHQLVTADALSTG